MFAARNHRAVGQLGDRSLERMHALSAFRIEPLAVQDRVNLGRLQESAVALCPRGLEGKRALPLAIKARSVTGSERRRLVEEEQLGPALPCHDLASNILV